MRRPTALVASNSTGAPTREISDEAAPHMSGAARRRRATDYVSNWHRDERESESRAVAAGGCGTAVASVGQGAAKLYFLRNTIPFPFSRAHSLTLSQLSFFSLANKSAK